jgi:hypothetical protein
MMMVVSFTGVLLVPLLFLVLGLMYSYGHFGLGSLITTMGAVLYLITSTRSVASNITNLIRFFSQARLHHRLLDAADDAQRRAGQGQSGQEVDGLDGLELTMSGGAAADNALIEVGESVMLSVEEPISNFTLASLTGPLVEGGALSAALCDRLAFVGATYKFSDGTVWEHLAARNATATPEEVEQCCSRLNALAAFQALPDGLQTRMSEEVWSVLDRHARLALRIVPLILSPTRLVLIDSTVLQGVRGEAFDSLLREFAQSFVFVTVTAGNAVPEFAGRAYGVISGGKLLGWGDRDWFVKEHPMKAKQASAATADDEVLQTMLSAG